MNIENTSLSTVDIVTTKRACNAVMAITLLKIIKNFEKSTRVYNIIQEYHRWQKRGSRGGLIYAFVSTIISLHECI